MNEAGIHRYPLKLEPHSSHSELLDLAGKGLERRILDVGCAQGDFAIQLEAQGWKVTGIEPDPSDAEAAKSRGLNVICGPIESVLPTLEEKFDAVLFGDVLEHLVDPWTVLQSVEEKIPSEGSVFISVPNVAHVWMRVSLMLGKFEYTQRGITDMTHLRFFTLSELTKMMNRTGYEILSVRGTGLPLSQLLPERVPVFVFRLLAAINGALPKLWKRGFSYQFVVKARPSEKRLQDQGVIVSS